MIGLGGFLHFHIFVINIRRLDYAIYDKLDKQVEFIAHHHSVYLHADGRII